jgi:hypothetical protein
MTGQPCLALEHRADDPEMKMAPAFARTSMPLVGIGLIPEIHLDHG